MCFFLPSNNLILSLLKYANLHKNVCVAIINSYRTMRDNTVGAFKYYRYLPVILRCFSLVLKSFSFPPGVNGSLVRLQMSLDLVMCGS